jgi:ppGpp synthetase/RelA/SpoT-type nucleotidyltranferase
VEASDLRIAKEINDKITKEVNRISLLYRVFYRVKTIESLQVKFNRTPNKYSSDGKKVQDLYGYRITVYFPDDIQIVRNLLSDLFEVIEETVDKNVQTQFGATRCNIVYRLPIGTKDESTTLRKEKRIDDSFEVQYRTVLSEGWHEVEHDLRYKCADDWKPHVDLDRAMNGILASLETSDWGLSKLFEDLAYRHYKSGNWNGMIRAKFRLRIASELNEGLLLLLNQKNGIGKKLYRIDRAKMLQRLCGTQLIMPINMDNIIYFTNYLYMNIDEITEITPRPLLSLFEEHMPK